MESSALVSWPQATNNITQIQKKCFFIDDDEDDRDFFCAAVESISGETECHFAANGILAIDRLRSEIEFTPDFIFIDMHMPMMDGSECLRAIRSIPRLQGVPVYMYSTWASPKAMSDAMDNGATQFLVKPATLDGLAALLKPIINAHN